MNLGPFAHLFVWAGVTAVSRNPGADQQLDRERLERVVSLPIEQVVFVSPCCALPEIWQCVVVSRQQPLKSKVHVADLADLVRVQG